MPTDAPTAYQRTSPAYANGTAPPNLNGTQPRQSRPPQAPPVFEFSTDADLDDCLTGIEWLWPGYIPRGFLTLLTGEQDQGKSNVAQSLCDIILRGHRWPDGQPHTPQPNTQLLWIDTEGSIALFHQRARSWGMPRGRFILPKDPLTELTIDDPKCWAWIEAAADRFAPPAMIIDALSGAHTGKANEEDSMKPRMKKLATFAQQRNMAVIIVHHLSKPQPGVPLYPVNIHRVKGSTSISQYCRSIIALGSPDLSQPERRRLDVIKLNLARKPEPVGYELTDQGPLWGDAPEPPKPRRAVEDAADFLSVALANGPRPVLELEDEATAKSIGGNALKNAKKLLRVVARREGGAKGKWLWFPHDYTPTSADDTSADDTEDENPARAHGKTKTLTPLTPLTPLMGLEVKGVNGVNGLGDFSEPYTVPAEAHAHPLQPTPPAPVECQPDAGATVTRSPLAVSGAVSAVSADSQGGAL